MYTLCSRIVSYNCAEILEDGLTRRRIMARAREKVSKISALATVVFLSVLTILLCRPSLAPAQDLRASISGTISDPSGAPVPGASVVITDVERGVNIPVVSNQSGRYSSGPLVPGHYTISVEAQGFKKFVRTNILLVLTQQAGVDVALELGAVNQTVNVTTTAPLLETETASRGAIVTPDFVRDLPNNGRDIFNLVFAMPGAYQPCTCVAQQVTITGSGHATFGMDGAAMGSSGRTGNDSVLVDGTADSDGTSTTTFQPGEYAVDQVQVKTNTYDAQYGRSGGGFVAVNTKAGTNTVHGIVFERYEDAHLTANSWLNDSKGVKKGPQHDHYFGFEIGGPIYIPKLFNGKNRLFGMISLDRWPESSPSSSTTTVPTAAQKQGNFSGLLNSSGAAVTIYDPTTAVLTGGKYLRTAFSGNVIPTTSMSTIGKAVANFYPLPNTTGVGPAATNNYIGVVTTTDHITQWLGRVDYVMSDKNRFYTSFGKTSETITSPGTFTGILANGTSYPGHNNTIHGVTDWTTLISPTLTLDAKLGFARSLSGRNNSFAAGYNPTTLGFPSSLVSQFYQLQFPTFSFSTYGTFGPSQVNTVTATNIVNGHIDLAKSRGKHFLRMGTEFIQYGTASTNYGFASGTYAFSPQWTQLNALTADSTSGNDIASLLVGIPTSGSVAHNANPYFQSRIFALYFQDDWKVNKRLSLNLGMRWDYNSPISERHNRIVDGFAFNTASPIAAAVAAAPGVANCPACTALKGGLTFASASAPHAWQPDYNGFTPRLGFAYQTDSKTVLRGGFGMYISQQGMGQTGYLMQGYSVTTSLVNSNDGGVTPAISLSNPFPTGLLTPVGSSQGLSTLLGTSIGYPTQNFPNSYSYQWSIGLQRQLPAGFVVEASYVGNKATRFPINLTGDAIPTASLGQAASYYSNKVTNPFAGLLPNNSSLNGSTIAMQYLLTPYPEFSGVGGGNVPIGFSRYDAAEVSVTRRFSNGTSLMFNYTNSKNLAAFTALNAQDYNMLNPSASLLEKRLSTFDVPQKWDLLGTQYLPFGKGMRYGSSMPKALDEVVGGWKLSWNITIQSGFPVGYPSNAANVAGSAKLPASQRTYYHWFNTSLFPTTAFPSFTYRNFPTYFPDVRFMGERNVELGLMKDFPIYERVKFRLRADFTNAFNHPFFTTLASASTTSAQFGQLNVGGGQNNSPRDVFLEGNIIF
jgi:hypothetical protein